jgi:hypothetical protein
MYHPSFFRTNPTSSTWPSALRRVAHALAPVIDTSSRASPTKSRVDMEPPPDSARSARSSAAVKRASSGTAFSVAFRLARYSSTTP